MRLNGFAFLWALLTARVAAALEPVTVAISIAAVSALSGYLTYSDFFSCRFSECCKEDRPLNVSGTCPRAARGGRAGGRAPGVRFHLQPKAAPRETGSAHLRRPFDDRRQNRNERSGASCARLGGGQASVHLHPESPPLALPFFPSRQGWRES